MFVKDLCSTELMRDGTSFFHALLDKASPPSSEGDFVLLSGFVSVKKGCPSSFHKSASGMPLCRKKCRHKFLPCHSRQVWEVAVTTD